MSPRYAVLSLVALFVIFLLILKNYETWTRPIETAPERTTTRKQEAKIENPAPLRPQRVAGPAQSYVAIAGKNIFSPDRKDFPVQSSEARAIVRPQVILYGVTIGNGYQFASIVNPGRRLLRGERETLSVKVGDKVGDYKLAKISSDRITLEAEGDAFEVLLYDPKAPKKRVDVKTETKPATVTSTLPSPQAGAASPAGSARTPTSTPSVTPKSPAPTQQFVSPPVPTPSAPSTSPLPYIRRGRVLPSAGYPSEVPPPGATSPATGQTQGTGGN